MTLSRCLSWMMSLPILLGVVGSVVAEPLRVSDREAIATLEKLGAVVRPTGADGKAWDVEFHLRGRHLTDAGLVQLAKLKNIEALNLRDTKITSAGLVHLKGLTSLRRLHLERTKIDDSGLVHLSGLTNLRYLNLYKTSTTDKGLAHLGRLERLERLYVWQTKVTDSGVAKLTKSIPGLRVVRGVDLSKLPAEEVQKPSAKPVAIKWMDATKHKHPAKSVLGSNITVLFENKKKMPVKLYWVSYGGELKLYATLKPGETRRQNSYSEAVWLITDEKETPLGFFVTTPSEVNGAVIPG